MSRNAAPEPGCVCTVGLSLVKALPQSSVKTSETSQSLSKLHYFAPPTPYLKKGLNPVEFYLEQTGTKLVFPPISLEAPSLPVLLLTPLDVQLELYI